MPVSTPSIDDVPTGVYPRAITRVEYEGDVARRLYGPNVGGDTLRTPRLGPLGYLYIEGDNFQSPLAAEPFDERHLQYIATTSTPPPMDPEAEALAAIAREENRKYLEKAHTSNDGITPTISFISPGRVMYALILNKLSGDLRLQEQRDEPDAVVIVLANYRRKMENSIFRFQYPDFYYDFIVPHSKEPADNPFGFKISWPGLAGLDPDMSGSVGELFFRSLYVEARRLERGTQLRGMEGGTLARSLADARGILTKS